VNRPPLAVARYAMRQTALVALRCATSLSWLAWIESCAALAAPLLSEVTPRSARPQQQLLSWRLKLLSLSPLCASCIAAAHLGRARLSQARVLCELVAAAAVAMAEVEETLKRINSHKGVQGIVIMNSDAVPIRSTFDSATATKISASIKPLAEKARSVVRDLDPQNDLTFLRIRSKKNETLVRRCHGQSCCLQQETENDGEHGLSVHHITSCRVARSITLSSHASASSSGGARQRLYPRCGPEPEC
jgi:dynein light chain roadblock-type